MVMVGHMAGQYLIRCDTSILVPCSSTHTAAFVDINLSPAEPRDIFFQGRATTAKSSRAVRVL